MTRLLRPLVLLPLLACAHAPAAAQRRAGPPPVWKCAFELAFGEGSPYAAKFPSLYELPYDVSRSITKEVLDRVVAVALRESGARRVSLAYLPGGYMEFAVQPSAQLDARGSREQALAALRVVGYLAQQTLVIASRRSAAGERAALQVTQTGGAQLASPQAAQAFWQRLSATEPKLNPGFSGTLAGGRPGLFVIDTDGDWAAGDEARFDAAAAAASVELKVKTSVEHFRVEYVEAGNDWKRHAAGEEYLERLRESGRGALAARLERLWRPRVERWIARAFARRGLGLRKSARASKTGLYPRKVAGAPEINDTLKGRGAHLSRSPAASRPRRVDTAG
jgi:hypothetical protein